MRNIYFLLCIASLSLNKKLIFFMTLTEEMQKSIYSLTLQTYYFIKKV